MSFLVMSTQAHKPGAVLIIIGTAVFIPIGFIGVLGARRILDDLARRQFEAKRAEVVK
jgi:hypothetical protein